MDFKSSTVSWSNGTFLSTANFTAAPEMWCVSRNGMPFLTKYSAKSVANISATRDDFIFSGFNFIVAKHPAAICKQSDIVSTVSNIPNQPSWKSLLYVVGVPFKMHSKPVSVPICLPAFPLNNSNASGFFFCGMRELPVEYASDICIMPNCWEEYTTKSSDHLEMCMSVMLAQNIVSMTKSRSETASMEFGQTRSKFKSFANSCRSTPNGFPANAPLPSGIVLTLGIKSCKRMSSLCHAAACDNNQCENRTVCADCKCVNPGIT
mmetsp:Transcript_7126/g.23629  ORF Transcript_7126/g.23629 Transcript_7126/m.23629 type:complete len:264 (+) Transcript_7126:257-1048(+)